MSAPEKEKQRMDFDYCPSCGGSLDTGWKCTRCGRDWMPWAELKFTEFVRAD